MQNQDIVEYEIMRLVREQMGLHETYLLTLEATADSIGADSLDQVELAMSLEDHFNLEDTIETSFTGTTIGDLIQYIRTAKRRRKMLKPLEPNDFINDNVFVRELASHNPGKLVLGIQTVLSKTRGISKEHGHVIVQPRSSICVYQYGEVVLDTQDFNLAVKKYNELLNTPVVP